MANNNKPRAAATARKITITATIRVQATRKSGSWGFVPRDARRHWRFRGAICTCEVQAGSWSALRRVLRGARVSGAVGVNPDTVETYIVNQGAATESFAEVTL